jgi:hypothetical protein
MSPAPIEEKVIKAVRSLLTVAKDMGSSSFTRRGELASEFTNYPSVVAFGHPLKVYGWKTFDRDDGRCYSAEHVIDLARNGDADADEVLQVMVAELNARGRLAPDPLQEYVADKAAGKIPLQEYFADKAGGKIGKRSGQPRKWDRNYFIALAVREVIGAGYEPSRNPASDHESACSIVAREATVIGLALAEKTIADIWTDMGEKVQAFE